MRYRALAMRLRWELREDGWRPGMRLPSITRLAQIHGTSGSTVIRALRILASEGLVEIVHSKGVYVLGPNGDRGLRTDRPREVVQAHIAAIASVAKPGQPLPSTTELAQTCGTTVQTVYRALLSLARRGKVRRVGRGLYVKV